MKEDYGKCKDFVTEWWLFVTLMFYEVSCENVATGLGSFLN